MSGPPGEASLLPGLYVVATPIGNLGDLSPRARAVLLDAAVICAEDTRTTGRLLEGGAAGRLLSLTEHNVAERIPRVLEAARAGAVALVSDAGTPVVADPGARLVEAAHAAGIPVFAVAGPSALSAAVSVSGFEGSDVLFIGFLPRPKGERLTRLRAATSAAAVIVFFESPGRLAATLGELAQELGDPEVCVCRELTKLHEEVARGRASELAGRFAAARGECTVVLRSPAREAPADETDAAAYMAEMRRAGARRSAAAAEAARRFKLPRERMYALWDDAVEA